MLGFINFGEYGKNKIYRPRESHKYSDETLSRTFEAIMSNKGTKIVQDEPAEQIMREIYGHKKYKALIMQMYERLKNDTLNR